MSSKEVEKGMGYQTKDQIQVEITKAQGSYSFPARHFDPTIESSRRAERIQG
jgi:hypothetical protein